MGGEVVDGVVVVVVGGLVVDVVVGALVVDVDPGVVVGGSGTTGSTGGRVSDGVVELVEPERDEYLSLMTLPLGTELGRGKLSTGWPSKAAVM